MKTISVLTAFKIYDAGNSLVGVADVTLPKIEFEKLEQMGAGIAGSFEQAIPGHTKPMSASINFHSLTDRSSSLLNPSPKQITVRGSLQETDTASGVVSDIPLVVKMTTTPVSGDLGKISPGSKMDTKYDVNVQYLKVDRDGKNVIEIDPANMKCKIDGVDVLEQVRANIG